MPNQPSFLSINTELVGDVGSDSIQNPVVLHMDSSKRADGDAVAEVEDQPTASSPAATESDCGAVHALELKNCGSRF